MSAGKLLVVRRNSHVLTLLIDKNRLLAASASGESELSLIGNIYIGKIQKIAPNTEAAFVEITKGVLCFLPLKDAAQPFLTNRVYDGKLKGGDELLVQVVRDAQKTKLPSVTAKISLTGQYCVVASGSDRLGISGKLSAEMKKSVKEYLGDNGLADNQHCRQLHPGTSYGFVIRTNCASLDSLSPLLREWTALEEEFSRLISLAKFRPCFTCMKQSPSPWITGLNNFYRNEYNEIITDSPDIYQEIKEYLSSWEQEHFSGVSSGFSSESPSKRSLECSSECSSECSPNVSPEKGDSLSVPVAVRLYEDSMVSLQNLYCVEHHLESALGKRVWLKSGGYLIIEPTEALTVIDVNSGKYEAKKASAEEACHYVNMEAAEEIALQLRLRNLSGIIIVDFINVNEAHQAILLSKLQSLVKKDSIKTSIIDITPLGLMEITRKKTSRPLAELLK